MNTPDEIDIAATIVGVAAQYGDHQAFARAAADAAAALPPGGPDLLLSHFSPTPWKPDWLSDRFLTMAEWDEACQMAIVEIVGCSGADGLPALCDLAFGNSEVAQFRAIDILCDMAAGGIQTEDILEELRRGVTELEGPPLLHLLDKLLEREWGTQEMVKSLKDRICELRDDEAEHQEVISLIDAMVTLAPDEALTYIPMLRRWTLEGVSYGPGADHYTESEEPILEWRAIRSALVLHRIDPGDAAIREALRYWQQTHANEEIREMIAEATSAPR